MRQSQFKYKIMPHLSVGHVWLCTVVTVGLLVSSQSVAEEVKVAAAKPAVDLTASKQSLAVIKSKVAEFLTTQTIGYPGDVSIQVGAIDPNLRLAACDDLELFLPQGSRAWGKISVGVQCQAPGKWRIYVQNTVKVIGNYLVAAAPLAQGQVLSEYDVMVEKGDLTHLPAGVFTEQTQAIGRSVQMSMTAGTVLRQEMLKVMPVVQQGQTVKLFASGSGFSISAEGQALAKANEGQVTQVKVASGKVISGIARQGGQVEVAF